jgi:hypothetical protein
MPLKPQRTEKSCEDRPTPATVPIDRTFCPARKLRRVGKIGEANVMCKYS